MRKFGTLPRVAATLIGLSLGSLAITTAPAAARVVCDWDGDNCWQEPSYYNWENYWPARHAWEERRAWDAYHDWYWDYSAPPPPPPYGDRWHPAPSGADVWFSF